MPCMCWYCYDAPCLAPISGHLLAGSPPLVLNSNLTATTYSEPGPPGVGEGGGGQAGHTRRQAMCVITIPTRAWHI